MKLHKGEPRVRVNLFGGRGSVSVWSLLEHQAAPFTAVLSCELAPGGSVGRHLQEQYPEIVVGLAGHGEARVAGTRHSLDPGDVVHLPLGATLELANLSDEAVLAYLIIKARG